MASTEQVATDVLVCSDTSNVEDLDFVKACEEVERSFNGSQGALQSFLNQTTLERKQLIDRSRELHKEIEERDKEIEERDKEIKELHATIQKQTEEHKVACSEIETSYENLFGIKNDEIEQRDQTIEKIKKKEAENEAKLNAQRETIENQNRQIAEQENVFKVLTATLIGRSEEEEEVLGPAVERRAPFNQISHTTPIGTRIAFAPSRDREEGSAVDGAALSTPVRITVDLVDDMDMAILSSSSFRPTRHRSSSVSGPRGQQIGRRRRSSSVPSQLTPLAPRIHINTVQSASSGFPTKLSKRPVEELLREIILKMLKAKSMTYSEIKEEIDDNFKPLVARCPKFSRTLTSTLSFMKSKTEIYYKNREYSLVEV